MDVSSLSTMLRAEQLYDMSLSMVTAKDILRFKTGLTNTSTERLKLGQALLHLLALVDHSIILKEGTVLKSQWHEVKRYLSDSSKVLSVMKGLKPVIESGKIHRKLIAKVRRLLDSVVIDIEVE